MQTQSENKQASQTPGDEYISGSFASVQSPEEELHQSGSHTESGNNKEIGSAPGHTGTNGKAESEDITERKPITEDSTLSAGDLIDGSTVVDLVDIAIPPALVWTGKKMGYDIGDKKEYQLTAKEKTTLAKPVQKCLESLNLNLSNPWHALIISITAIYGAKFIGNSENVKRIKKTKVVKANFVKAPQYNFPATDPITEASDNEYEKIKQEEQIAKASLAPEAKRFKKLVDDTRKQRKESISKSIAWLQKKGKLPPNYFYPEL